MSWFYVVCFISTIKLQWAWLRYWCCYLRPKDRRCWNASSLEELLHFWSIENRADNLVGQILETTCWLYFKSMVVLQTFCVSRLRCNDREKPLGRHKPFVVFMWHQETSKSETDSIVISGTLYAFVFGLTNKNTQIRPFIFYRLNVLLKFGPFFERYYKAAICNVYVKNKQKSVFEHT